MEPLVTSPVFVMTLPRSGSTLLRCILDSHPLVRSPHELHFTCLEVEMTTPFTELAMKLMGFGSRELEHMLWDRILHHELTRSAKQVIVEKDPRDLLQWERFCEAWPQARFIFIIRHPGAIYASIEESRRRVRKRAIELNDAPATGEDADLGAATVRLAANNPQSSLEIVVDRIERMEEVRHNLAGLTIRYEDLVSDTERVTREVCDFLGVPWDERMLDYGAVDHGPLVWGVADSSDHIKSGRIAAPRALPTQDMPAELLPACRLWGYL